MKLSQLLCLPAALAACVLAEADSRAYSEHLHLQPLPGNAVYAGFDFSVTSSAKDYDSQHFRLFPRSLGQILQFSKTSELHLRFSLGRWDDQNWGSRPRNGGREGGTGVELWAWVEGQNETEVTERWKDLVNGLSGLFCASLNFIDSTNTIRPLLSFDPEGIYADGQQQSLWLLHGALPHEVVCTENLTPFLKLLPCKGKAGVGSLLDGHKLFDASWQTMSVDVRPICAEGACEVEIKQTVDMVLDIQRSMRPRHDPIPRPPPIESIECDPSKPYNMHDTCFPLSKVDAPAWSLSKIFGRPVKGSCRPGQTSDAEGDISISIPANQHVELAHGRETGSQWSGQYLQKQIGLHQNTDFDMSVPSMTLESLNATSPHVPFDAPPLYVSRQMTGHGQERGGMHTIISNPLPKAQRIVILESLPWYLRPYMHTLKAEGGKVQKMFYTPAIDRKRGTQVELLLEVPAESTVELGYDFEKATLRYTEYPPDANRGFDVAPAIIRILPPEQGVGGESYYLRTTSLLLPLPTPDFSMPYNVIILTSTVIALGFGSVFNLLVRRFVLAEEVPPAPLAVGFKNAIAAIKGRLGAVQKREAHASGQGEASAPDAKQTAKVEGNINGVVKRNTAMGGSDGTNGSVG